MPIFWPPTVDEATELYHHILRKCYILFLSQNILRHLSTDILETVPPHTPDRLQYLGH